MTDTLRKLAEAATPGPWEHVHYLSGTQNVEFPGSRGVCVVDQVKDYSGTDVASLVQCLPRRHIAVDHRPEDRGLEYDIQRAANGKFIAAANPTAVIALLDEITALRAKVKALETLLEEAKSEELRELNGGYDRIKAEYFEKGLRVAQEAGE